MSSGARITIGIAALLGAIGFAAIGATLGDELPAGSWPFYGMAAFSAVVALACFARKSQPVALRIVGVVIFVAYLFYAFDSFGNKNFVRALVGFLIIGVPAGYLAITGRYPSWGR